MHQDFDAINALLHRLVAAGGAAPAQAYSLGHIAVMAEEDHVVLTDDILEQIAGSNNLNDATGYYATWLLKRTEANGGVFKRDW